MRARLTFWVWGGGRLGCSERTAQNDDVMPIKISMLTNVITLNSLPTFLTGFNN